MKKGEVKLKKGFTIIETSLVLAVAGLIFLMVFLALPALQRSQRDDNRREDMMSFASNLKNYQTNNRGALPVSSGIGSSGLLVNPDSIEDNASETSWAGFYRDYLEDDFADPDGPKYKLLVIKCSASSVGSICQKTADQIGEYPNDNKIVVTLQALCSGEDAVAAANPRRVAISYKLEGGGIYCGSS